MLGILFAGGESRWEQYRDVLPGALARAGLAAEVRPDLPPSEIDYIVYAPHGERVDFRRYPDAKAVLSLWAGVESIVEDPTLTQPLTRMVDDGLRQGMQEWVAGHVLRHHLGMDAHIVNPHHRWVPKAPPLAQDRPVTILGLGELGTACAEVLADLGFPVTGWSRTQKSVPGVTCLAGPEGLSRALAQAEILVLLLPLTDETENLLDAARLRQLPQGAVVLNPGRGPLIDDTALLAALDRGQISQATLDVFRKEPLPEDHPYWAHPRVTVTPHIASETRPGTASEVVAENVRRSEAGEPLLYLVDRSRGY